MAMDVREKLIKLFYGNNVICDQKIKGLADDVMDIIAPVQHGKWECQKPCPVCGEDRFKGLDADIWSDWEPPYCPNCGAKMNDEVRE